MIPGELTLSTIITIDPAQGLIGASGSHRKSLGNPLDFADVCDFPGFFYFSLYGPREGNDASPGVPGCVGVFSTTGWAIPRTFENPFVLSFVEELVVCLGVGR